VTSPAPPFGGNDHASVLVVDDNPANIELLHEILRSDYRVLFALNGDDAVATALEHQPDLILLDVIMPERDGYATCAALKSAAETSDIPVIFVTAMDRIEDEEKGLGLGAVDYIAKPFSPAIVRLRVGHHIELKRQRDILYSLSQLDGLTGVANRRAFDATLQRYWYAQARRGQPLTVVMVDIDHFKAFNDGLGHYAGDECLKQVAEGLLRCVQRGQDLFARFGGEEFACLLPDTAGTGATEVASRMVEEVRALEIAHPSSPVDAVVTVSVGVCTCVPTAEGDPVSVVDSADKALYAAKRAGRGRFVVRALAL